MRLFFIFFLIVLFNTACSSTPEIAPTNEQTRKYKIISNQSMATDAQNEYKKLQEQRSQE